MGIKTKIGLALATTAVGAAMIGGGTFALFTSTATNAGNTFTAGNITIDGVGANIAATMVNYNNLAPGDTGSTTVHITNNGSLDEWVKVNDSASTKTGALFSGTTPLQLTSSGPVRIPAHGSADITVSYSFPAAADNTYQGASGTASIVFQGVQARNNEAATAPTGPTAW